MPNFRLHLSKGDLLKKKKQKRTRPRRPHSPPRTRPCTRTPNDPPPHKRRRLSSASANSKPKPNPNPLLDPAYFPDPASDLVAVTSATHQQRLQKKRRLARRKLQRSSSSNRHSGRQASSQRRARDKKLHEEAEMRSLEFSIGLNQLSSGVRSQLRSVGKVGQAVTRRERQLLGSGVGEELQQQQQQQQKRKKKKKPKMKRRSEVEIEAAADGADGADGTDEGLGLFDLPLPHIDEEEDDGDGGFGPLGRMHHNVDLGVDLDLVTAASTATAVLDEEDEQEQEEQDRTPPPPPPPAQAAAPASFSSSSFALSFNFVNPDGSTLQEKDEDEEKEGEDKDILLPNDDLDVPQEQQQIPLPPGRMTEEEAQEYADLRVRTTDVVERVAKARVEAVRAVKTVLPRHGGGGVSTQGGGEGSVFQGARRFFRVVKRPRKIEIHRDTLPIIAAEQGLMESVLANDVVIVAGETGSGKTTQVPQFLFEYGFGSAESGNPGSICVTQPRRVAAVASAKRVSEELGLGSRLGGLVGVHVRHFRRISDDTKIRFVTDGILMKEIQSDVLLLRYSVVIIDEAHERNVNTDILLGWLARVQSVRNAKAMRCEKTPWGEPICPLKVLIMSATLRVADFSAVFVPPPPVITIRSRQFPVTAHFNKQTVLGDYVAALIKKILQIHERLPAGGILAFLTGRDEIELTVDRLRSYERDRRKKRRDVVNRIEKLRKMREGMQRDEAEDGAEVEETTQQPIAASAVSDEELINQLGDLDGGEDDEAIWLSPGEDEASLSGPSMMFRSKFAREDVVEDDIDFGDDEEGTDTQVLFRDRVTSRRVIEDGIAHLEAENRKIIGGLLVLPLFSKLSPKEQFRVFAPPPPNTRLCVIATNVAETSITIPGIRYVVDCGRAKYKTFDPRTGASSYVVRWIPRSSSDQRAGRAGRTCPGHCYRLYSSAVYQRTFTSFSLPEILTTPVDSVVLQMKAMDINSVLRFPFPTPPDRRSLRRALHSLVSIGALRELQTCVTDFSTDAAVEEDLRCVVTPLGRRINHYPVHPRFGRMLLFAEESSQNRVLLPYVITLVSIMTVGEIFVDISDSRCGLWRDKPGMSDMLSFLRVVGAYLFSNDKDAFCEKCGLIVKAMKEIMNLNRHVLRAIDRARKRRRRDKSPDAMDVDEEEPWRSAWKFPPPTLAQKISLRRIICSAFNDQHAMLVDSPEWLTKLGVGILINKNKRRSPNALPYVCPQLGDSVPVRLHPQSFILQVPPEIRKWVVYQELVTSKKGDMFMRGITVIQEDWIASVE